MESVLSLFKKLDNLNKRILFTGATSGLGKYAACELAYKGNQVLALARNKERGIQLTDFYRSNYPNGKGTLSIVECDLSSFESITKASIEIKKTLPVIDALINNAGITKDSMTRKMTDEQWDLVIDVNLKGVFNLVRYIGPQMMVNNGGSIINISSVVGEYGNIGQANYAATKAGLLGLTKTWAKEFARKGAPVRCNAIAPGFIETEMTHVLDEKTKELFLKNIPLGRLARPDEVADVVNKILFISSSCKHTQKS